VLTYENRVCNARQLHGHGYGIDFYGTTGTLFIDRAGFEVTPEMRREGQQLVGRMAPASEISTPDNPTHARNFIDCIKSRQLPICDIEVGHRSSSTAILGNLAYRSGALVVWDAAMERVTNGNQKAAERVDRQYRAPWSLTV
jgi:hypothetical protein